MAQHWQHSIEVHKQSTQATIAEAAWQLAQQQGPLAVSMSDVAEAAGVSRPTLYKYFADVESMLLAHHRSHVAEHLAELTAIADGSGEPADRLGDLLQAYGRICHARARHGDRDVDRLVHTGFEVTAAEGEVTTVLTRIIEQAAKSGHVRGDVSPPVLAAYCVRALAAAADVKPAAVDELVDLIRSGLSPT